VSLCIFNKNLRFGGADAARSFVHATAFWLYVAYSVRSSYEIPFVSSMSMTLPISLVLEICVNLLLAPESDVVALRGGTTGGTLVVAAVAAVAAAVSAGTTPVELRFTSPERLSPALVGLVQELTV